MVTNTRYQVYRYPYNATDHRSMVATLAILFLMIALGAIAYLAYMASRAPIHDEMMDTASMAHERAAQSGAQASVLHSPVFINSALLH